MSVTEVVQTQGASFDEKTSEEDKVKTRSRARVSFALGEEENDTPPVDKNVTKLKPMDKNSEEITFFFLNERS